MSVVPYIKVSIHKKDKILVKEEKRLVLGYEKMYEDFFIPALQKIDGYLDQLSDYNFVIPHYLKYDIAGRSKKFYFRNLKNWKTKMRQLLINAPKNKTQKFILSLPNTKGFSVKETFVEGMNVVKYHVQANMDILGIRFVPKAILKIAPVRKKLFYYYLSNPTQLSQVLYGVLGETETFRGKEELLRRIVLSHPYILLTKILFITKNNNIVVPKITRPIDVEFEVSCRLESYF